MRQDSSSALCNAHRGGAQQQLHLLQVHFKAAALAGYRPQVSVVCAAVLHLATNTTVASVGLRWLARAYLSSSISTVWPGTCTTDVSRQQACQPVSKAQGLPPMQVCRGAIWSSTDQHKAARVLKFLTLSPARYGSSCSLVQRCCAAKRAAKRAAGAPGSWLAGKWRTRASEMPAHSTTQASFSQSQQTVLSHGVFRDAGAKQVGHQGACQKPDCAVVPCSRWTSAAGAPSRGSGCSTRASPASMSSLGVQIPPGTSCSHAGKNACSGHTARCCRSLRA